MFKENMNIDPETLKNITDAQKEIELLATKYDVHLNYAILEVPYNRGICFTVASYVIEEPTFVIYYSKNDKFILRDNNRHYHRSSHNKIIHPKIKEILFAHSTKEIQEKIINKRISELEPSLLEKITTTQDTIRNILSEYHYDGFSYSFNFHKNCENTLVIASKDDLVIVVDVIFDECYLTNKDNDEPLFLSHIESMKTILNKKLKLNKHLIEHLKKEISDLKDYATRLETEISLYPESEFILKRVKEDFEKKGKQLN